MSAADKKEVQVLLRIVVYTWAGQDVFFLEWGCQGQVKGVPRLSKAPVPVSGIHGWVTTLCNPFRPSLSDQAVGQDFEFSGFQARVLRFMLQVVGTSSGMELKHQTRPLHSHQLSQRVQLLQFGLHVTRETMPIGLTQ